MRLSIQEDPVIRTQELVRNIDDTGFDEGRRIEAFAGHVARRGNDNEPKLPLSIDVRSR